MKSNRIFGIVGVAILIAAVSAGSLSAGFTGVRAVNLSSAFDSFHNTYYVHKIANGKPLFTAAGGKNEDVWNELLETVANVRHTQKTHWNNGANVNNPEYTGDYNLDPKFTIANQDLRDYKYPFYFETTAQDFSCEAVKHKHGRWANAYSGAVLIKLFEVDSTLAINPRNFAEQYWQLVYRASEDGQSSFLTLWMVDSYRTSNHTTLQSNISADFDVVKARYSAIEDYIATPEDLTVNWQTNEFQTGTAASSLSLVAGRSGFRNGTTYSAGNGLSLNVEAWAPSPFEAMYMGHDKDNGGSPSYVHTRNFRGSALTSGQDTNDSVDVNQRHGLWQLNGFDRASAGHIIGSGSTNFRTLTTTGTNCLMSNDGSYTVGTNASNNLRGVRPALHLKLPDIPNNHVPPQNPQEQLQDALDLIEQLKSGHDGLLGQIATVQQQHTVAIDERDTAIGERNTAVSELNTAIGERDGLRIQVVELKEQLEEVPVLNTQIETLSNDIQGLNETITTLEQTSRQITKQYKAMSEERDELLDELDQKEEVVEVLRTRVAEVEAILSTLNISNDNNSDANNKKRLDPIWFGVIAAVGLWILATPIVVILAMRRKKT